MENLHPIEYVILLRFNENMVWCGALKHKHMLFYITEARESVKMFFRFNLKKNLVLHIAFSVRRGVRSFFP